MGGNPNPSPATRFKPGQSGNPAGGSRKTRLTTALIRAIEEKGLDDPFVKVGLQHALKGDFRFWAYIFDRVDGKVPEKLIAGDDGSDDTKGITIPTADPRYEAPADGRAAEDGDRGGDDAAGAGDLRAGGDG